MRIDAHNHLGGPDKGDGKSQSADEILYAMDRAGVEMAVVFPFNVAEPGVSFSNANGYIAGAAAAHPDRLIGFCRLDPNFGDAAVKELKRSVREFGLKGVKLHPSSQGFEFTHPALADILALAEELSVPVVFDTGKRLSPPSGVARLAQRFPRLDIIMAHMNLLEETIEAAKSAPNIHIGTTGYFNANGLIRAVAELGYGRFISGSDSPYINMGREEEKVRALPGIAGDALARMLGGNMADLLFGGGR